MNTKFAKPEIGAVFSEQSLPVNIMNLQPFWSDFLVESDTATGPVNYPDSAHHENSDASILKTS